MMNSKQSLKQQFIDTIQKGVTLVDFNALWCEPCRIQKPILHQLSLKFRGKASFLELNVDKNQDLAMSFGITSIPTMVVFQNGQEVHRFIGLQDSSILSAAIDQALS